MAKLIIDKLILVEGKYDKIRLENIVDADIFVLNGFGIYNNKQALKTIKSIAGEREILLITDSDFAGYKIRVYLSKVLKSNKIANVFVPQIEGKEKRKILPSAQGFLGVEGISDDVLIEILSEYASERSNRNEITHTHLYQLGFTGSSGATARKNSLLRFLGVQTNISNNFLLKILNERYTLSDFEKIINEIEE